MSELITLSASKLKTYTSCPKKYWYEYVQKDDKTKHPAAVLGTAVHRTIEKLHRGEQDAAGPIFLFSQEYQKESDANGLPMDNKLFKDGMGMVELYDFTKRQPVEMELKFTLNFPNTAHALCQIVGYIDQVYENGFVDLKTNKYKPMRGVLDNDLQFIIYAWAFKEIYGFDPQVQFWNHLRTAEDLEADAVGKVDQAARVIERILESTFTGIYDACVGDSCRICSYRKPCLGRED